MFDINMKSTERIPAADSDPKTGPGFRIHFGLFI